jgi:hypothetical protein
MDRKLVDTMITLAVQYDVDGVATDPTPDTATVTVTRADGAVLVDDQNASDGDDGLFTYTIPAEDNDRLDTLTAAWTSALGTVTTVTEIVGGFIFSLSELQDHLTANRVTGTYTAAQKIAVRTIVETKLEKACGQAFVPRYTRTTVSGTGTSNLLLAPRTTAIRSVTIDDVAQTVEDETYDATTGLVYWPTVWTAGTSNIVVGFEHGHPYPPEDIKQAALTWAKSLLVAGPIDDRTTSLSTEDGTFSLSTPGIRGSVSGIPAVDQAIAENTVRVGIA